jgi:hypothetical protein
MTKNQLAEVRTLRMVSRLLPRFASVWNRLPAMGAQLQVLDAKLELIEQLSREQEQDRSGLRADKSSLAEQLVAAVMRVAGPLGAWALVAREDPARLQAAVTPGALRKLGAERLVHEARAIHQAAGRHLPRLADYGVTAETLAALTARTDAFEELVLAPREGVNRTAALTRLLAREIDSAMELLRGFFDRMIYLWEADHPDFVAHYQAAARVIRPPRGRRTKEELARAETPEEPVSASLPAPVPSDESPDEEATADEVRAVFAETDRVPEASGQGSVPVRPASANGNGDLPKPALTS